MIIRELTTADYVAWYPLWQGYLEFYESAIADDVTRISFDRMTGKGDQMGGFVAEAEDGALLGIVHWIRHPSTWTRGDYCYLQDLFIQKDGRGSGMGRALIEAVYTHARETGCDRVYWLTHQTNEAAMHLYDQVAEKSGFLQYRKVL